jgi:hypothetical protein
MHMSAEQCAAFEDSIQQAFDDPSPPSVERASRLRLRVVSKILHEASIASWSEYRLGATSESYEQWQQRTATERKRAQELEEQEQEAQAEEGRRRRADLKKWLPEFPPIRAFHEALPSEVLDLLRAYIVAEQAFAMWTDPFLTRGNAGDEESSVEVPFLSVADDPDDLGTGDSADVLLLLVDEDEDVEAFTDLVMQQIVNARVDVESARNGRAILVEHGGRDLAILTVGRGTWCRPEDYLDHLDGVNPRNMHEPPVHMLVLGDTSRPLPGSSPEAQLELLCEAIETRGVSTGRTSVAVDLAPWSDQGAGLYLSEALLERLAKNHVSLSINAVPDAGSDVVSRMINGEIDHVPAFRRYPRRRLF